MDCPQCGSADITVVDSRDTATSRRRRRGCFGCQHRWTTYEVNDSQYSPNAGQSIRAAIKGMIDHYNKVYPDKPIELLEK